MASLPSSQPEASLPVDIADALRTIAESLHPRLAKLEVTASKMTFVADTLLDIRRHGFSQHSPYPKFCRFSRHIALENLVIKGIGNDPDRPFREEKGVLVAAETNTFSYYPLVPISGEAPDYVCKEATEENVTGTVFLPVRDGVDPQRVVAALRRVASGR